MTTIDRRDPRYAPHPDDDRLPRASASDNPVRVEVTDASAAKLAKMQSEHAEAHRHLENTKLIPWAV